MLKEQAGKSAELLPQADGKFLEHQYYENITEIYRTIHTSSLNRFTYSLVDSLWNDLSTVLYKLERLSETAFKKLIEVSDYLTDARNELRLARFLFDVEEINAVHRLLMRNRAVLRGKERLHKVLRVWPVQSA